MYTWLIEEAGSNLRNCYVKQPLRPLCPGGSVGLFSYVECCHKVFPTSSSLVMATGIIKFLFFHLPFCSYFKFPRERDLVSIVRGDDGVGCLLSDPLPLPCG